MFPFLTSFYTDITEEPLIAGQFLVYSGPTVGWPLRRSEGQVIDLFFIKTCELHYLHVSLQRFCRIFKFIYPELA